MPKRIMRTYKEEFKQEAIHLALQSPSVDAVAKNLGIPGATWKKKEQRNCSNT
jgi:transposase-like protein